MNWKQNKEISNAYVQEIADSLNCSQLMVRILLNRCNDVDFVRKTLVDIHESIVPPELLVNGQAVADRIAYHIRNNSKLYIHADYDADGLNAGFLMYDVIKNIIEYTKSNATVEVYFPSREHGYGLSHHFANKILETHTEDRDNILIITVDNGIAQIEQINTLVDNNIEVIVTDHHESQEVVPNCLICDPHNHHVEQDDTFKHLCGTGVAFKVCELLQKNFDFHDMYKYVVNVAIATITDVMPLVSENISLIKYGLEIINSDYCPAGIKTMIDFLGIDVMNASNIAWEIGPRLNACGRMNNTILGGKLLLTNDIYEAEDIVNEIEVLNDKRKTITQQAKEQVNKIDFTNDLICIAQLDEIPEGIVGIIAGQTAEMNNKPAIIVTEHDGILSGSARSINGLNLQEIFAIEKAKGNIINFGGHAEAAGISFYADDLYKLKSSIEETISNMIINTIDDEYVEDKSLLIDECIEIDHLNKETFDLINSIPYDNNTLKKPTFALVDCEVVDYYPTKTKPENLWLVIKQNKKSIKLWCQGMTDVYKALNTPKFIHLAGHIEKNFMSGRPYTFKVIDIASA